MGEEGPVGGYTGAYDELELETDRGGIACRYYRAPGARAAVVCVGGIGGGFDSPARGLYPRLCGMLRDEAVSGLRVRFRYPTRLDEAVHDVLAGTEFLRREGVERLGFVGHSFGGAVVVQAAARAPESRAVVTLATQGYGTAPAAGLGPRCALLLLHGTADEVLGPANSEHVLRLAKEPKELVLYDGAGHGLDEVADSVEQATFEWLRARLVVAAHGERLKQTHAGASQGESHEGL